MQAVTMILMVTASITAATPTSMAMESSKALTAMKTVRKISATLLTESVWTAISTMCPMSVKSQLMDHSTATPTGFWILAN